MFRSAAILAFSLSMLTGAAVSAQTEPAAASSSEVVSPTTQSEKKICKRSQQTGTRLGSTRVCKTAREWELYEFQMRNDASAMTEMKGHTNAASGSGN